MGGFQHRGYPPGPAHIRPHRIHHPGGNALGHAVGMLGDHLGSHHRNIQPSGEFPECMGILVGHRFFEPEEVKLLQTTPVPKSLGQAHVGHRIGHQRKVRPHRPAHLPMDFQILGRRTARRVQLVSRHPAVLRRQRLGHVGIPAVQKHRTHVNRHPAARGPDVLVQGQLRTLGGEQPEAGIDRSVDVDRQMTPKPILATKVVPERLAVVDIPTFEEGLQRSGEMGRTHAARPGETEHRGALSALGGEGVHQKLHPRRALGPSQKLIVGRLLGNGAASNIQRSYQH